MAKYRKILVAYDGSSSSKNALSLASHLAREDKSWIKVVAVVPAYEGDLELTGVGNIKEAIEGPGKKLLADAMAIAEQEDVHILTDLEQGEPYERIVHVAEEENCDLIVLGRKGRHPVERELMGAVTARVIGHTGKDVLVVPENCRQLQWERLLLATDGSRFSQQAVHKAITLAKERQSKLTAITVVYSNDEFITLAPETHNAMVDEAHEVLDTVTELAAADHVAVEVVVKEGDAPQAITDLAMDQKADMIIMGSHGRKGLTRLLMGSVTERVIGFAGCPVLISHLSS